MKKLLSLKNKVFSTVRKGKKAHKMFVAFMFVSGLICSTMANPISADLVSRATQTKDDFLQTAQAVVIPGAIIAVVIGGLCQLGGKVIAGIGKGLWVGAVVAVILVFAAPDLIMSIPH